MTDFDEVIFRSEEFLELKRSGSNEKVTGTDFLYKVNNLETFKLNQLFFRFLVLTDYGPNKLMFSLSRFIIIQFDKKSQILS